MKVYFIPGLGASSKCFEYIQLPPGYQKEYIEWYTPWGTETLEEYARTLAQDINTAEPFILVGYSFGGVMVQEMHKFLKPEKTILIASMKEEQQIPLLFKIVRKTKFTSWFPMKFFSSKGILSYAFARSLYFKSKKLRMKEAVKLETYMSQVNPKYMKWSISQITQWKPSCKCENIYQIHGTKDPVFPYKKIVESYSSENKHTLHTIEGANHILVLESPKKVNSALENILEKP